MLQRLHPGSAASLHVLYEARALAISHFYAALVHNRGRAPMVCLYHSDYGPGDPAFDPSSGSPLGVRAWSVDAFLLKDARNIGEAEAIQRHLLRGEQVSWCQQGYAWAEQDAVGWLYVAAFLLVVLPYVIMKIRGWKKGVSSVGVAGGRWAEPAG